MLHENPFKNDPFALVWLAYKNLYNKPCEVWWDVHEYTGNDEVFGQTIFPDDGGVPQVFIYADHPVNVQTETFGHELAHIAVGEEHDHDEVWEAAFDAIFNEYNRICEEMFPKKDGENDGT